MKKKENKFFCIAAGENLEEALYDNIVYVKHNPQQPVYFYSVKKPYKNKRGKVTGNLTILLMSHTPITKKEGNVAANAYMEEYKEYNDLT
jgi:hypothetical protein